MVLNNGTNDGAPPPALCRRKPHSNLHTMIICRYVATANFVFDTTILPFATDHPHDQD